MKNVWYEEKRVYLEDSKSQDENTTEELFKQKRALFKKLMHKKRM